MHPITKSLVGLSLFCALYSSGKTLAADAPESVFPEQVVEKDKTLILNGIGLRLMTIFKVKVYLAALYLEKRMTDENEILKADCVKKLDLLFLRDVEAKDIVDSWKRGFTTNCKKNCDALRPALEDLNGRMINVKKGQKVTLLFADNALEIRTPGKNPARIPGGDFAKLILATFIGDAPPTTEVKLGLLGKLPGKGEPNRSLSSVND